ncbi:MAG: PAS domain-containing protein [Gammaproteobacteria bacterium]|nr:PAS domain-containing protein [Gammaproteobacteria bacterium]
MRLVKGVIEFLFGLSILKSFFAFVSKTRNLFKENTMHGESLLLFIIFLFIQLAIILFGIISQSYFLITSYLLVALTSTIIVFLIWNYKNNKQRYGGITLEDLLEQLPGHIYWKNRDGVCLCSNKQNWSDFGVKSIDDYVGKTDHELFPKEEAEMLREADQAVMKSGKLQIFEELITGGAEQALYLSHKAPLRDRNNKVIGIIGTSVDITISKRETLDKLKVLENIIAIMPGNVYWMDRKGLYLGCNDNQARAMGLVLRDDIIGKRNVDIQGAAISEVLDQINNDVINTGKTITIEEPSVLSDGREGIFLSTKAPLYNYNKKIVGIVSVSIDITQRKEIENEAERLKLENQLQNIKLQEQEKFRTIAEQVAHDIRSPLASLSMIVGSCKDMSEPERVTLRDVALGINDIANNLLSRYKKYGNKVDAESVKSQHVLVSLALLDILSEKRYQYKNLPVKFNSSFGLGSDFASISANPSDFNRMISNLVNNAVEAIEEKAGKVDLQLNLDREHVNIVITDNGKGMSHDVIDKIMNSIPVTSGKRGGTGIGFTQVRGALQSSNGSIQIKSNIGAGTSIILTFPRVELAGWLTEELSLDSGSTVIVLDDDLSIHGAWKARFEGYKSDIELIHYKSGKEVIEFVSKLTMEEKNKVFLLSDFELIGQEYNGLQVIGKTSMEGNSILVTSHYGNADLLKLVFKSGVKVLPKQLAPYVSIVIKNRENNIMIKNSTKKIDVVVIDDVQIFADSLSGFFQSKSLMVDTYYNPKRFLANLNQYSKNTKICMDNHFQGKMTGIELAKYLYEIGYTRLYLISGKGFEQEEIPDYLTVIIKGDMEALNKIA